MKVVISDRKTGKSYQTEIDDEKAKILYGKKIGDVFDGALIDLAGYKLKITGGTDKDGFPMRPDVHGPGRKALLLSSGPGYKPRRKGEKRRKTVRGNTVSDAIAQLNTVVIQYGKKPLEELFKKEGDSGEKENHPT